MAHGDQSDKYLHIEYLRFSRSMKRILKKVEPVVTLIAWSAIIFYFSSVPGLRSAYTPDIVDLILRKTAHIVEFIVLIFLSYRVGCLVFHKKNNAVISAVFYSIFYAISDEIHQTRVLDREGKIIDVGIDAIGIFIAAIFLLIIINYREKQSK